MNHENKFLVFRDWIVLFYKKDDNAIGDLARDIKRDRYFPRSNNVKWLRSYLRDMGAIPEAIETLNKAFAIYKETYLNDMMRTIVSK